MPFAKHVSPHLLRLLLGLLVTLERCQDIVLSQDSKGSRGRDVILQDPALGKQPASCGANSQEAASASLWRDCLCCSKGACKHTFCPAIPAALLAHMSTPLMEVEHPNVADLMKGH